MSDFDFSEDELKDKMRSGELSRRQFHRMLAALGIGVVAMPVLSNHAQGAEADQATYFTWGGYDIPELFGPYKKKYGELPNFITFGGSEEALTKMRTGFVVDVSHPCNQAVPRWMATGLFQPIDTDKLSNWPDVMDSLKHLPGAVKDGKTYFAPCEWGDTSITYRTDLVDLKDGQESWDILWDERYKGRIAVIGSAADTWWCAAIYAGVPFDKIATDENMKKVADLLRKQQPLVRLYTDDVTTMEQSLASGEVVAAMTWNDSAVNLKKQGVPVTFARPKEGTLTWVCGPVLHKDAPHPEKAHMVIDSLLSPESGEYFINSFGYGHSNIKAFDRVSKERLAELSLSRNPQEVLQRGHFQTPQTQEFETKTNNMFEQIKAGF